MKIKKLLLFLAISLLLGCNKSKNTEKDTNAASVTIKGSDTVLPLAQKEAEEIMKVDDNTSITVVGGGTGVGITALIDGTTDIAMASRDLKTEEKLKFFESNLEIEQKVIAFDALSIIVHPENSVKKLTRQQLEEIFTGVIKNWKEVGGMDQKIVAYSRESSSGTYEFFKETVLDNKNYSNDILSLPATGAIVQAVGQTKGAIGYVGLAYKSKEIKQLEVSYDNGKTYVAPTVANAKNKSYPISRPLFYMFNKKNSLKVAPFVKFALSKQGQKIVEEIGYVPLQ